MSKKNILPHIPIISLVILLSFIPIFIYSLSWTLVIDSIWSAYQKAWYLWYLHLSLTNMLIVSFFFTIGTAPIIYKYCDQPTFLEKITLWISVVSLWLIVSKYIWYFWIIFWGYLLIDILWISEYLAKNFFIALSVNISTYILLIIFSTITTIKLKRIQKLMIALIWGIFAIVFSYVLWWIEFVWNWWWIPIFKMITLIARNVSMSLVLLLVSIRINWESKVYVK